MADIVSQIEIPINSTAVLIDINDSRLLKDNGIVIIDKEINSSSTHLQIPNAKVAYELMKNLE